MASGVPRSRRASRAPVPVPVEAPEEPHTAPHDEIVGVVRDLLATSPAGVSLDTLANALRERGFSRPPGSPRLITRLRRIKELDVARSGMIRLVENGAGVAQSIAPPPAARSGEGSGAQAIADATVVEAEELLPGEAVEESPTGAPADETPADGAPRRRRRRGGRRRRGRRNGAAAPAVAPETA